MAAVAGRWQTVVHVSPHPDDELLGAPALLMALRDGGARVIDLALSLGREPDRERRGRELALACERAGFELELASDMPPIGRDADHTDARERLSFVIAEAIERHGAELVIGPSPRDAHHGHETVGAALRDAVTAQPRALDLMFWGLWGDLPAPTVLAGFDDARLAQIEYALSAHAGELERNDYATLVRARAEMNAVLGAERVFGFGSRRTDHRYAELLSAFGWTPDGALVPHAPEFLDASASAPRAARAER